MADVPSPVDFHDHEHARAWVDKTVAARPWRPRFFQAFASVLNTAFEGPAAVLEIGPGPGHLAREILAHCRVAHYTAVDFSAAMHALAREHLGAEAAQVTFLQRDFREPDWAQGLCGFDAVVTMQAAHEVRHRRHLPALFRQIRSTLRDDGLLLFCDHYAEPGSTKHPDLFLRKDEQPAALADAGFQAVETVLDLGGMVLYRAHAGQMPVHDPGSDASLA